MDYLREFDGLRALRMPNAGSAVVDGMLADARRRAPLAGGVCLPARASGGPGAAVGIAGDAGRNRPADGSGRCARRAGERCGFDSVGPSGKLRSTKGITTICRWARSLLVLDEFGGANAGMPESRVSGGLALYHFVRFCTNDLHGPHPFAQPPRTAGADGRGVARAATPCWRCRSASSMRSACRWPTSIATSAIASSTRRSSTGSAGREDEVLGREIIEVVGRDVYQLYRAYIDAALAGERTSYERQLVTVGPAAALDPRRLLPRSQRRRDTCAASSSPTATSIT